MSSSVAIILVAEALTEVVLRLVDRVESSGPLSAQDQAALGALKAKVDETHQKVMAYRPRQG